MADSTPHQQYKLVMQALPRRYFEAVCAEDLCPGRRTFGARFMGPEVTEADLEAFVRARLGQNAQCLKKVMSFSNSFEIYFSEEKEPDNLIGLMASASGVTNGPCGSH